MKMRPMLPRVGERDSKGVEELRPVFKSADGLEIPESDRPDSVGSELADGRVCQVVEKFSASSSGVLM